MSNPRIRVITPHSDAGFGDEIGHRHVLMYPGDWRGNEAIVYRDAIGRKGKQTWAWLPLICGMLQNCPASVLVRRDLLEEIAQFEMDVES